MIEIKSLSRQISPAYPLDPANLEFGRQCTPNFFVCEYRNGTWGDFFSDFFLAHYARQEALFWAMAAVVLQGMVIALLLRNRRK